MGLTVNVYTTAYSPYGKIDCTNGGVSSGARELTLVNVDGPFEPTGERPAAFLAPGNTAGTVKIIPAVQCDDGTWSPYAPQGMVGPMMGGNYAATSDSRFSEAIEKITGHRFYGAVAIHDRYETPEQYRVLST